MRETNLRWLAKNLDFLRVPLNGSERADRQGQIPYWGANGIVDYVDQALLDERVVLIGEDGAPFFDPYKEVAFVSDGPIWPNNHIHILKPNSKIINERYLCYFLNQVEYAKYINGSTRDKLTQAQLGSILISYPKLSAQISIADFLDRETARIDQLIGKKSRFIALLKEKRAAVITHAVTGGIDPAAPMKDSGGIGGGDGIRNGERQPIFLAKPLKSVCRMNLKSLSENTDPEQVLRYIDISSVSYPEGVTSRETMTFSSAPSRARRIVEKNETIISTVRTYLRAVAMIDEADHGSIASTGFAVCRANGDVDARFLYYAMMAEPFIEQAIIQSTGISYPAINSSTLGGIKITVPDKETQKAIARFLDRETARIDSLTTLTERGIELLREKRAALITTAVTGQIDVATRGKQGQADRRLDEIGEAMRA